MKQFDYIIAGAGAAGLTLAYLLMGYEDKQKTILIIDKDSKTLNDRTWCFWEKEENLLEPLVFKKWTQAKIGTSNWSKTYTLEPYSYKMIRGIDFYQFMKKALDKPNITWIQEEIISIDQKGQVSTSESTFSGQLVFDSTFQLDQLRESSANTIIQHFKGKIIKTNSPQFDEHTATYMDFSVDQEGDCRFGYILPFDKQTALVEYTLFNKTLLSQEEYDNRLVKYIQKLGIENYEVIEEEFGVIPMTDFKFITRQSPQVFNIGIKGGFAKASTGYSFLRAQKTLHKMVENICRGLTPDLNLPYQTNRDANI